jgi:outer membrane protein
MNRYLAVFVLSSIALFTSARTGRAASSGIEPQKEPRILTLQEAVRLALARAPEILFAEAQAIRAREAIRETRSLNRPQVVTGTGLAYNNGMPLSMEGASPSIFQVSASQSIFSKKNNNLVREAEESGKATGLGTESARNELASRTALVYYQLHQSNKTIELTSARLGLAQKNQEQMETLREAGRVRPVDVQLARTATQSIKQQLLIAREQMKMAEAELRELTGLTDSPAIKTVDPQLDNPAFALPGDSLYKQALENTPEILQSAAMVKAKEFHVEAERGERLPKADIIGQYALFSRTNNYQDYFNVFTRNNFLIGLSLQVPVFDGFRASSRVAQSRHEVSEAKYKLEGQKSGLKLNIERILSALRIARGALDFARDDADAARELIRANEALLESGRIGPQELNDSRSMLHQKEMAFLEADQEVFQKKLELLKAIGTASSALQ